MIATSAHNPTFRNAVAVLVVLTAACARPRPADVARHPLIGAGRGIDHVTLLSNDVSAAASRFAEAFGFTVGPARKLSIGFESAVIYFPDLTYVELFSIHDREVVRQSTEAFALEAPEGLTWVTLHVDSARRAAQFLAQSGRAVFGPQKFPSDDDWRFQLTGPEQPFLPGGRVFFIEYNDSARAQSRAANRASVDSRETHANGALGLRSVWITVPDLDAAARTYADAGMIPGPEVNLAALSARAREIRMPGGTIVLAQPRRTGPPTSSPPSAAFAGISIKVASVEAVRSSVLKQLGTDLQTYPGLYGRSVLIPASLAFGAMIEFFE